MAALLVRNSRYLAQVEKFRNKQLPPSIVHKHVESFRFEQGADYQQLLQQDTRSRLVVSFHFGDFIYGPNVLSVFEGSDRKQYFLTQLESTAEFLANWKAGFGDTQPRQPKQLIASSTSAAQLLRLLRAPGTTLLTFADLPPGFGRSTQVQFLGRQAVFPSGPATLSVLSQSPMLPILNVEESGLNQVIAFPQLEPSLRSGESRKQKVQRLTQKLATILEIALLEYGWQWRYLSVLPAYFAVE
ncbi:MAG: hypothetical protein MI746_08010 [Pseudomonadales bacterium]|nr:hypothetical protein [Pseudomonadales bacterium]